MTITDRYFRIDWFKCFVKTSDPFLVRQLSDQLYRESILLDEHKVLGQKFWHKIYGGEDFKIMVNLPPTAAQIQEYFYCLELPGKFFNSYSLKDFYNLCGWLANNYEEFDVRRVDVACDYFPCQGLANRPWENYLDDNKLKKIHTIKRITSSSRDDFRSTCYLGSRQGEQVVRLYTKDIDDKIYDRWEVEFKRAKAQQLIENFINDSESIFKYFFGSIQFEDDEGWFKNYQIHEGMKLSPLRQDCSIDKSLRFFESLAPSMAMLYETFGDELFNKFREIIKKGKPRLRMRHHVAIQQYYNKLEFEANSIKEYHKKIGIS